MFAKLLTRKFDICAELLKASHGKSSKQFSSIIYTKRSILLENTFFLSLSDAILRWILLLALSSFLPDHHCLLLLYGSIQSQYFLGVLFLLRRVMLNLAENRKMVRKIREKMGFACFFLWESVILTRRNIYIIYCKDSCCLIKEMKTFFFRGKKTSFCSQVLIHVFNV